MFGGCAFFFQVKELGEAGDDDDGNQVTPQDMRRTMASGGSSYKSSNM